MSETSTGDKVFFYDAGVNFFSENLDHFTIYDKTKLPIVVNTGALTCDGYYINSDDGYIYNSSNTSIVNYPCWSLQLNKITNDDQLIYVKLQDNGIYRCNVSDPASTTIRLGNIKLIHNNIYYCGNGKILLKDDGRSIANGGSGIRGLVFMDITDTSNIVYTLAYNDTEINAANVEIISFATYNNNVVFLDSNFKLNRIINNIKTTLLDGQDIQEFYVYNNNLYYIKNYVIETGKKDYNSWSYIYKYQ